MSAVPTGAKNLVAKPLKANPFASISIDVIIPFKDNHANLLRLIEEIYKIRNVQLNLLLIDDNSEAASFLKQFEKVPWIKSHRFEEDKGFGYCVNHGVKVSTSQFCFVIHSDVYNLPQNIFKDMVLALDAGKSDKLAMVSALVDNPVPKTCTYITKSSTTNIEEYYKLLDKNQFLPLICVAFSKNAFSKVGGLPTYPVCFFEDKLLAEKFNLFGYNFGICNRVLVRHYGSATINQLLKKDSKVKTILEQNKKRYLDDIAVINSASKPKKDLTAK